MRRALNPRLAQRSVALAAVALLAGVVALGVASWHDREPPRRRLPAAVPAPGGGWYEALAAPMQSGGEGRRTACGYVLDEKTRGVTHAVLPCGVKLYVAYEGAEVLTQVIGRPSAPGRQFELTRALARVLALPRRATVRWRYARA